MEVDFVNNITIAINIIVVAVGFPNIHVSVKQHSNGYTTVLSRLCPGVDTPKLPSPERSK